MHELIRLLHGLDFLCVTDVCKGQKLAVLIIEIKIMSFNYECSTAHLTICSLVYHNIRLNSRLIHVRNLSFSQYIVQRNEASLPKLT